MHADRQFQGPDKDVTFTAKDEFLWTSVGSITQSAGRDISVTSFAGTDVDLLAGSNIRLDGGREYREFLSFTARSAVFDASKDVSIIGKTVNYEPADLSQTQSGQDTNTDSQTATSFLMDVSIAATAGALMKYVLPAERERGEKSR